MEEYASNSHKSKREQSEREKVELESVVSNPVKVKKKGTIRRFLDLFVAEEQENIKEYVLLDVVVPALKDLIWKVATGSLEMKMWGNGRRTSSSSSSSKISYSSYYDRDRVQRESKPRTGYNFDEIILENRGEAEDVLSRMDELISSYGMASVADFYDLVGIVGNHTDNKYGWTDIRNASVVRTRDGYIIKFPKAMPIT